MYSLFSLYRTNHSAIWRKITSSGISGERHTDGNSLLLVLLSEMEIILNPMESCSQSRNLKPFRFHVRHFLPSRSPKLSAVDFMVSNTFSSRNSHEFIALSPISTMRSMGSLSCGTFIIFM